MGASKSDARSAAAWRVAARQHGVLTRRDLLALGFTPKSIRHRVARGRLFPLHRGVYAVGLPRESDQQRWMAAILACGEGAALSHRSAGALWGIATERGPTVEVVVRGAGERKRDGVRVRGRQSLSSREVAARTGIPVTTPACTLVELATALGPRALERAVNEADKLDLIDPETLRDAIAGFRGRPGVRALRRLLDRDEFRLSDSQLEVDFHPIAAAAGLSAPLSKQLVNGYEVDFHWPELGLIVETDGLRYHRTPASQARDRVRDQAHVAAGLTVLRFTHFQVTRERDRVRSVLEETAERLRG